MKSLYVHIPFCLKKCLFCSFAISVAAEHRMDEYIDALEIEIKNFKNEKINTIYFGGGTPTMLNSFQISRIIRMIENNFDVDAKTEWSIEANPDNINTDNAQQLRSLGFNRISLGVQTFDETYLKFLGRVHDRTKALSAYQNLRDAGFDNINVDLMYGFPKQTRIELSQDLEMVVSLNPQHVSIYTLTIEPHSKFYAKAVKLDADDKLADDYVYVADFLSAKGLMQYEVSNFARAGFESKHNMVYWTGGDYIGIGMGAHGLINDRRYWNEDTLASYIDAIKIKGKAVQDQEKLSKHTRLTELLIFGLRMNRGVSINAIETQMGVTLNAEQQDTLKDLVATGFLSQVNGIWRTTQQGRLVLDDIAVQLI